MHGIICIWSGTADNIPAGWVLCDGQNGTPDLRNRFVQGHTPAVPAHTIGGSASHVHLLTIDSETDNLAAGDEIVSQAPDGHLDSVSAGHSHTGLADRAYHYPKFYTLCFIMKL